MNTRRKRGATTGQDDSDQGAAPIAKTSKKRAAGNPRDEVPADDFEDAEAARQPGQKRASNAATAPQYSSADIMAAIMESKAMMAGLQQQVHNIATREPVKELSNKGCNLLQDLGLQMQTESDGNRGEGV